MNFFHDEAGDLRIGRCILISILAIFLIITFFLSWTIIPTGYTGVRSTFGQISEDAAYSGFNWKIPYVQNIIPVNNKQQDLSFNDKVWSETSERTVIYFENITVTYTINKEKSVWLCSHINDYSNNLIRNDIVSSAIKTASKQFTSVDATNRGLIEPATQEILQKSINDKYGEDVVFINKVIISNIDFEESYNAAIAEKQNAQLAYEKAAIDNQKAIEKAAADAEVARTQAEAKAAAKLIEAEAESKANQMVSDSITDTILRRMYYERWNGVLPKVVTNDSNIIVPMNEME